jgi:hypothetical protein
VSLFEVDRDQDDINTALEVDYSASGEQGIKLAIGELAGAETTARTALWHWRH